MEFKEQYTEFNSFYYQCLDIAKERAEKNPNGHEAEFFRKCAEENVDFITTIYEKLVDGYDEIELDSKKYQLLPKGLINGNVYHKFINKNYTDVSGRFRINELYSTLLHEPKFRLFYYPNHADKPEMDTFRRICESYRKHYEENLKEFWSDEDFYKMISDLKYLSVKYALDLETGEIFAVGFFGTYIRSGAGGKALTNAELYVMPEFRCHGIAKKMVGLSFELAKGEQIENFDSITYRVLNHDALAFWKGVGASVSGLYHIEGNIPEMLQQIEKEKKI
ncbi:MAG: GNAT family N-acetyltransferase [Bacilli bacterium]|nr:GNAT family N-acetyltransferase [Bacilli bacterium]